MNGAINNNIKDNYILLLMEIIKNINGNKIKKLNTIYIGYDFREHLAVQVLIDSIERHASKRINVITINIENLRRTGLYRRAPDINSTCWGNNKSNNMIDSSDKRPFSTEFSFSRFLVPHLNQYEGFALFMDCDMYFKSDPCEIFNKYATEDAPPVRVVKHTYEGYNGTKMYGCHQVKYSKKNWSSFVLWNCSHPSNFNLTVDDINTKSGNWLHNFKWLNDDNEIGGLSEEWNWLDGYSNENIEPKNVHFTTGGPWFDIWKPKRDIDNKYSIEWINLSKQIKY